MKLCLFNSVYIFIFLNGHCYTNVFSLFSVRNLAEFSYLAYIEVYGKFVFGATLNHSQTYFVRQSSIF